MVYPKLLGLKSNSEFDKEGGKIQELQTPPSLPFVLKSRTETKTVAARKALNQSSQQKQKAVIRKLNPHNLQSM